MASIGGCAAQPKVGGGQGQLYSAHARSASTPCVPGGGVVLDMVNTSPQQLTLTPNPNIQQTHTPLRVHYVLDREGCRGDGCEGG